MSRQLGLHPGLPLNSGLLLHRGLKHIALLSPGGQRPPFGVEVVAIHGQTQFKKKLDKAVCQMTLNTSADAMELIL